ncbi:glycosyltransferase family 9 protein [Propionivibrio dicarboxylicus]|uniref:Heptosyltransferase-3 n=1 Tax=Propionivibrio dicarboxylicus TaxID=83767 RepID=A0A1G8L030_9RHOO|nr:glycosyltransferase family 9 protein [Propionivibrio dicarboxylicus]SDI49064.1 heptosyltransferase-3 [Propionivibrio dicarboxylicus]
MPQKILYINVSRIGDTLLVSPAVRAVATAFPDAEITLLGHPKRAEVLQHLSFVHHVGTISKQRAPWLGWVARNTYDLAFVCGYDEPLIKYALRVARKVVAFRQGDDDINARLFKAVEHPPFQTEHAVDIQLRLPAAVGIAPAGRALAYQVTEAESLWARAELARTTPAPSSPLIGLQVASFPTKAYRDWPVDHFMALTDKIRSAWPDAHFLIFGGTEETVRTNQLQQYLGKASTLYAGRLTLRQTASLMNELDLYIGVDTGPTHIMGALHRPMVALYHGYSPSRYLAPLEHPCAYIVDHPLADQDCSTEAPMSDITVDRVWQAVARALSEHPPKVR